MMSLLLGANETRVILAALAFSLLLSAGMGLWFFKSLAGWKLPMRIAAALMPVAIQLLVASVLDALIRAPYNLMNGQRLATPFAVAKGFSLYYGPHRGPMLSSMYPPLRSLSYLPATLAGTPLWAVVIGVALSCTFFFVPMGYLHLVGHLHTRRDALVAFWGFLCFCLCTFYFPALYSSAFVVHGNAPSLGLGAAACAVLCHRTGSLSSLSILASAILAVASVLAKQMMAPILVALPVYLWIAHGPRPALLSIWYVCLTSGLACAALCVLENPNDVWFNVFTLPSRLFWVSLAPVFNPGNGKE